MIRPSLFNHLVYLITEQVRTHYFSDPPQKWDYVYSAW